MACPSSRWASRPARSVQFAELPPRPWTYSAGSAVPVVAGVSRTYVTAPSTSTGRPGQRGGKVSVRETASCGAMTAGCMDQVCLIHSSTASAEKCVQTAVDGGQGGPHDGLPGITGHQGRAGELLHRAAVDEQHDDHGDLAAAERYDGGVLAERTALVLPA